MSKFLKFINSDKPIKSFMTKKKILSVPDLRLFPPGTFLEKGDTGARILGATDMSLHELSSTIMDYVSEIRLDMTNRTYIPLLDVTR